MKTVLLLLFLAGIYGCSESVLDPNDLGGGNGGNLDPRTDRVYFVATALDSGGLASPSLQFVTTSATPQISTFSLDAFITSAPRDGKIAYITPLGITVENLADRSKKTTLSGGAQIITSATLSPDASRIAYTILVIDAQNPL